ncbi:MAG: hypothetical protein ACYC8W_11820 [Candidatus Tyrphobacter sp.]
MNAVLAEQKIACYECKPEKDKQISDAWRHGVSQFERMIWT